MIHTAKNKGKCIYCGQAIVKGQKRRQVQEGHMFASSHVSCYQKHIEKYRKESLNADLHRA